VGAVHAVSGAIDVERMTRGYRDSGGVAMRAAIAIGTVVLGASALSAQSPPSRAASWTQFWAPDSSFAVMVPAGRPLERSTQDSGYVTENFYINDGGPTRFAVRVQMRRQGASIQHGPSAEAFCATCLGKVMSDTTIAIGPRIGRWVLVDSGSGDPNGKATSMHRVFAWGARVYVISASARFGQSLSSDAGWFLSSFRLCMLGDPCPDIADAPPPWPASPFHYLPPTVTGGDLSFGTPDLGQPFFEYQVDKPVMAVPGSALPVYPPELKARKVEGEVVVAFVVDTAGMAEVNTLKILKSTDSAFTEAVRVALPQMRFIPALVGQKKVRQLVQQPFVFAISK
jgi:TonB family protein